MCIKYIYYIHIYVLNIYKYIYVNDLCNIFYFCIFGTSSILNKNKYNNYSFFIKKNKEHEWILNNGKGRRNPPNRTGEKRGTEI